MSNKWGAVHLEVLSFFHSSDRGGIYWKRSETDKVTKMACSTCELRDKDVINVCDGNRLGQVADFEIDPSCGRICALIVSPDTVAGMLFSKNRIRVPWDRIVRIGKDAVLVDVRTECKRPEEACGALKGALRKKLGL